MISETIGNDLPPESRVDMRPAQRRAEKRLSPQEHAEFKRCENAVARSLGAFHEAGNALAIIRNQRLYRSHFKTFRAYCRVRWGFDAARARQLIGAALIWSELKSVTEVTPINEHQIRPLARFNTRERQDIWVRATLKSPRPTDKDVRAIITEVIESETAAILGGSQPTERLPIANSVEVADTTALLEYMMLKVDLLLRLVKGWNYKVGLDSEQKKQLKAHIGPCYNALRDVSARVIAA